MWQQEGKKEHGLNGVTHIWLDLVCQLIPGFNYGIIQKVMGFMNAFLYGLFADRNPNKKTNDKASSGEAHT